jgi:HEAT repeat protein
VERLKRHGDVRRLVKALHFERDEAVRRAAAQALGEVGDPQVVPVLVTVMASDVCPVAGAAAVSVHSLGAAGVSVEDLVGALVRSRRWHEQGERRCSCRWRGDVIMSVTRIVRHRADKNHLRLMVRLLNDNDVHLREFAAMVLKTIGPPAAVTPLVARLSKERLGSGLHRVIFEAIASFRDPSTVNLLVRCIGDTPPEDFFAFRMMVEALAASDPPGLAERLAALIPGMRSSDQRELLANTVADDLASPALAKVAVAKAEVAVRRAPLERALAVRDIGLLVGFLDGEFAEEAQRGLSGIADPRMYDELIQLLRGNHWEFAASELGRRQQRQAIFPLIDQLRVGRHGVLPALAQLGVADVDEFLVSALDSPDLRTGAVSRVDPARALDPLRRIAADEGVAYHVRYLAQARIGCPPAGDPRQVSVNLLMSAVGELGLGRDLGRTPYKLGTVVDGTIPRPYNVDVSADGGRLFQEEYTYHSPEDGSWQRWRTPGYHWDVRRDYIGTYFDVTVRADGVVEFSGGDSGPYPADPDGWRATVAAFNEFGPGKHIHLWHG